jgi:oxygen-independent coproporphyrinogen-3 oxidase
MMTPYDRTPADLIAKYDRPGPRYTSYPTVPNWSSSFGATDYADALGQAAGDGTFALYAHFPYCARKCLYCGCTMLVTRRASHIDAYLDDLERELDLVLARANRTPRVTQMHWGGGTPNLLSEQQLTRAFMLFASRFHFDAGAELSIEADPRQVTPAQLEHLRALGFNRISFGVQDLDDDVQHAIGRLQPLELVRDVCEQSRAVGFLGLNVDVMYGLPKQTTESVAQTVRQVLDLEPDRVACFGYAHVPWMRPHQRAIRDEELPTAPERLAQFARTAELFESAGYRWIGLDHFAAPHDALTHAHQSGALHRNFMGYTTMPADHLLAFGMSAISEVGGVFAQNAAELTDWRDALQRNELPITRGYRLTPDDLKHRRAIMELMCNLTVSLKDEQAYFATAIGRLLPLEDDGLVTIADDRISVTPLGRHFLRHICMAFDEYLTDSPSPEKYSRTI